MNSASAYDVFLSYHWRDHTNAEVIAYWLREQGIKVFFDRWYLTPGRPWPQKLEEVLRECRTVVVLIGPEGMGSWQQREKYLALNRQAHDPAFSVIPVLLPGAEPASDFLLLNTWVDFKTGVHDAEALAILARAVRREPPGPDQRERIFPAVRVYRGLRPFREEDAPFFFGRAAISQRLLEAVNQHSFIALVGASGSGKSSVARAGLVPRLRQDVTGCTWEVITLVPGERPLHALGAQLLSLLEPDLDLLERREKSDKYASAFLKRSGEGRVYLHDLVADALQKQPGTDRLMLIVDQWEELYTLTQDDDARRRFIDELLDACDRGVFSVVLTLRGDFFGHALAYGPLERKLREGTVTLGPMKRDELAQAMRGPLQRVGLRFEPGLEERILDDVGDQPGNLPLLEFVLDGLWEARQGGLLLHETYEKKLHGLKGAIASHADSVLDSFNEREKSAARRIFLQLVRPGEEQTADTRRRANFTEIDEGSREVMDELATKRLIVTSRDSASGAETLEVAHEALIGNWGRLQTWLNEDRKFLLWRQRLRGLLAEWQRNENDESTLPRGRILAEAKQWLNDRGDELTDEECEYIKQGSTLREREQQAEKGRRDRELVEARAERRWKLVRASVSFGAGLAISAAYMGLADADLDVPGGVELRRLLDRYGLTVFRRIASHSDVTKRNLEARHKLRGDIAREIVNIKLKPGSEGGIWDLAQALSAVYRDSSATSDDIRVVSPMIDQIFRSDLVVVTNGRVVGWRDSRILSRAETAIWTIIALSGALSSDRREANSARTKYLRYLDIAQEIADNYYPLRDGGWNMVAEEDPNNHNVYTTALQLHALLELRSAELCWRGSCEVRDQLIRDTSGWLLRMFVDNARLSGWRTTRHDDKPPDPDLSVLVYGALGRAGVEFELELPRNIQEAALERLTNLKSRSYHPAQQEIQHWARVVNREGTTQDLNFPTRVLWYPWAAEALVHWIRYAKRQQYPPETVLALERSLSHIVVDLSDDMLDDMSRALLFVQAETLYGIGRVQ